MNSNPNPNYNPPMGSAQNAVWRWDPEFIIDFKKLGEAMKEAMKMFQPKFKIGDQVRVKKDLKVNEKRGGYSVTPSMFFMRGTTAKVTAIGESRGVPFVHLNNKSLYFSPVMLERVKPETIVIYQNKNKVIAKNTMTGMTAEARCNPLDEFDFIFSPPFTLIVASRGEKSKTIRKRLKRDYNNNNVARCRVI